jgi:molecular chaperone HtpG
MLSTDQTEPTRIRIPQQLRDTLLKDDGLGGRVLASVSDFSKWLCHFTRGLPFFPEYTDHGPDHINDVLHTANALIDESSRKHLTPEDAAVLVLASILHDSAMHLDQAGISHLQSCADAPIIPLIDTESWQSLWTSYVLEAGKWDDRKFENIFGQSARIRSNSSPLTRDSPTDAAEWDRHDTVFIGEFVRRHHPRLAHEIATNGVPGPKSAVGNLRLVDIPPGIADLAGVVARSHGMSLRNTFSYLQKDGDPLQEQNNVHAVYIMVLLRIADYLQIQSRRAPVGLFRIQGLRSPFSRGEWGVHNAVEVVSQHADPDSLYVKTRPSDVRTFLKLERLLSDVQAELDTSWAILGEVYHGHLREPSWASLKLSLRRVRSNLDDVRVSRSTPFVPKRIAFEAAGHDLLKLLILPLYGNRPEIGIRELLQNAIDATRQGDIDTINNRDPCLSEASTSCAEVRISIQKRTADTDEHIPASWTHWVEVSDEGVGMTPEVVADYFLRVGASFRKSGAWRTSYEDNAGHSRLLRSGYFGIGVLAAFLLGDEVFVSTRAGVEDRGFCFGARLDTEEIEARWINRPTGTTVCVAISEAQANHLSKNSSLWDWYCWTEPTVVRLDEITGATHKQEQTLFLPNQELQPPWRRVAYAGFDDIQWAFENKAPMLVSNGLVVVPQFKQRPNDRQPRRGDILWHSDACNATPLQMPNVSVADSDFRLKLNLSRDGLQESYYPFSEPLYDDVLRDFCAYCLVFAPEHPLTEESRPQYERGYPGVLRDYSSSWPHYWFCTENGTSFLYPWHIASAGAQQVVSILGAYTGQPHLNVGC